MVPGENEALKRPALLPARELPLTTYDGRTPEMLIRIRYWLACYIFPEAIEKAVTERDLTVGG